MRYTVSAVMTLQQFLEHSCDGMSKNKMKKWMEQERIAVNDVAVDDLTMALAPNDIVTIREKLKFEKEISIVYEDRDVVVVDKPRGLLSVASLFEDQNTMHGILKKRFRPKKIYVVHRLDQGTSGLMMFALSEKAYTKLKEELKEHKVQRKYIAIVEAKKVQGSGSWTTYLYEDAAYHVHVTDDTKKGEKAVTHYEVVAENNKYTALRFSLETGKKNQIRAQAYHFQAPLVGDGKYGGIKAKRLFLHAIELSFTHPITGKTMTFSTPIPKEFLDLVPELRDL